MLETSPIILFFYSQKMSL